MAKTKLTHLDVNEVSMVDAGANQHAHVMLYKNRDGKVPEGAAQQETAKSGLRKLFSAIGKALNVSQEDVDSAVNSIEKADTFSQKMEERKLRRISDEIWDVCYALESSLASIIRDEEVMDKAGMMNQSVDEFTPAIKALITSWAAGKSAQIAKSADGITVEHMQETAERLEEMIEKAGGGQAKTGEAKSNEEIPPSGETEDESGKDGKTQKNLEGGIPDMKFNEANMTAADKLAFDYLKKNYGIDDGSAGGVEGAENGQEGVSKGITILPVENGAQDVQRTQEPAQQGAGEDIYKGLHPAVAAELKDLRKRAEAAEDAELLNVAKKYEIIGKKPEELVPTLKMLKAAGGTAYADMIGTLDSAVSMVENSGVFGEIGKRGNGSAAGAGDAWAKIEKHAEDIRKASPQLSHAEAIDEACVQHPELVAEYEANR